MTKTAQEFPANPMAFHALRRLDGPENGHQPHREDDVTEFVADLANGIAVACIDSHGAHPGVTDRAVPLPREQRLRDDYCRVQPAPFGEPAPERPGIELLTAEGHMRPLVKIEGDIIRLAICLYGGKVTEVARRLNIGRSTLYRKLDEFGIEYKR